MKIPRRVKKNNREYIFVKKYPNFILYQDTITGTKECFLPHDLGLIPKQGEIYNISPNKVKI